MRGRVDPWSPHAQGKLIATLGARVPTTSEPVHPCEPCSVTRETTTMRALRTPMGEYAPLLQPEKLTQQQTQYSQKSIYKKRSPVEWPMWQAPGLPANSHTPRTVLGSESSSLGLAGIRRTLSVLGQCLDCNL